MPVHSNVSLVFLFILQFMNRKMGKRMICSVKLVFYSGKGCAGSGKLRKPMEVLSSKTVG